MADILYLGVILVFFWLSWLMPLLYVVGAVVSLGLLVYLVLALLKPELFQ